MQYLWLYLPNEENLEREFWGNNSTTDLCLLYVMHKYPSIHQTFSILLASLWILKV